MIFASVTHPGKIASHNEDSIFVIQKDNYLHNKYPFFLICDGVGGQKAGEVASDFVTKFVPYKLYELLDKGICNKYNCRRKISDLIRNANRKLVLLSNSNSDYKGLATTYISSFFINNKLFIHSVGDSRLYRFKDNKLQQISEDQSFVYNLYKKGEITRKEMRTHPRRNLITMVLGIKEDIKINQYELNVKDDEIYLLCSDGLTEEITDMEISQVLMKDNSIDFKTQVLLDKALKHYGKDNISIILIEV